MNTRDKIIHDFAEWTAFSATRSGCPIKSRDTVYPLIRTPNYEALLTGDEIIQDEFNSWHRDNTLAICHKENRLPVGWAAKLINVYLKTRIYIANQGRKGLITCIHPPIDNGLWNGIMEKYGNDQKIISQTHIVNRIKDITTYDTYQTIIEGCQLIAKRRNCSLIEVEELWQGTEI
ncbi:MAG: hypothetical protein HZA17_00200 [Nitrospirae bacterium]|nr:hypothetical protein [Nitrospirota bacterium]